MAEDDYKTSLIICHKKGVPVYGSNPSVLDPLEIKKRKSLMGSEKKGFIIDGAGEVLGNGTAVFYEYEEVDSERFIKMFVSGFKLATGLSKAGLSLLEYVCLSVQDNPNTDEVKLSFYRASDKIGAVTERTYQRGMRELLDREFLFRSPEDGVFFVNIRYMFNGNRLAFVKGYQRKTNQKVIK